MLRTVRLWHGLVLIISGAIAGALVIYEQADITRRFADVDSELIIKQVGSGLVVVGLSALVAIGTGIATCAGQIRRG